MVVEVRLRHARNVERVAQGELFVFISENDIEKFSGIGFRRASEADAFFLCGGNAFRLAGADVFAFVFRYEGEDLQNNIGNEFADEGTGGGAGVQSGISRTRISARMVFVMRLHSSMIIW